MVDFAQCSRVQYLKQSSKVSIVVTSQALFLNQKAGKEKRGSNCFLGYMEGGGRLPIYECSFCE